MNRRKAIKDHVLEVLGENLDDVSVYRSRRMAPHACDLPSLVVAIENESNELVSQSVSECKKTAQLSIEVIAQDYDGNVDILLDDLTRRIEETLHLDESFDGMIDRAILKHTESAVIRESELDLGIARMTYEILYYARPRLRDEELTDFRGVNPYMRVSER